MHTRSGLLFPVVKAVGVRRVIDRLWARERDHCQPDDTVISFASRVYTAWSSVSCIIRTGTFDQGSTLDVRPDQYFRRPRGAQKCPKHGYRATWLSIPSSNIQRWEALRSCAGSYKACQRLLESLPAKARLLRNKIGRDASPFRHFGQ